MPTTYEVRFATLEGKFAIAKVEKFLSHAEMMTAVKAYAEAAGYTNVKEVDDDDCDSLRITARTPGGRGGRNVAFVDVYEADS